MSIPFGFAFLRLMIVSKILEYKSEHHCDLSVRVFTHFAAAATLILLFPTSTIRAHSLRTFQLFNGARYNGAIFFGQLSLQNHSKFSFSKNFTQSQLMMWNFAPWERGCLNGSACFVGRHAGNWSIAVLHKVFVSDKLLLLLKKKNQKCIIGGQDLSHLAWHISLSKQCES